MKQKVSCVRPLRVRATQKMQRGDRVVGRTDFKFRVCGEEPGEVNGSEKIVLDDELGSLTGLTDSLDECQLGTP